MDGDKRPEQREENCGITSSNLKAIRLCGFEASDLSSDTELDFLKTSRPRTERDTCGFCRASSSILCHTSSLSFSFSFSLHKHKYTGLLQQPRSESPVLIILVLKQGYFCFSALYCCVQSSNSFWFISMKSFRAL